METPEHIFDAEVWTTVNRRLLRKMLSEFMYEELIDPEPVGSIESDPERTRYRLSLVTGVDYRFDAQTRLFDSYRVLPGSVYRREDGEWTRPADAVGLLVDAQTHIGIPDRTLGYLVREYNNTLLADAHLAARTAGRDDSELIVDMEYAAIEGEMTGHPWFTYNKGRVEFSYEEYLDYAPEMKRPQTLSWIAVRRDRATFSALDSIDHESLLRAELGEQYTVFVDRLLGQGLDPANYYFLPVHDWQWSHSVVPFFAGEIAEHAIVPMGEGPDEYLPQQSIRTLTNVDYPEKHHVKLPLRILNTNVYRGILGEQAKAAPRVTAFVKAVRDRDRFLREECELLLPGEVASVNYDHPALSGLDDAPYQFHELLGCVWRESVEGMLEPAERPVTLAALLHEDTDGTPILTEFVERSPFSMESWLDELFEVLLYPLCHYLYRYGTVFMPHGTNVVLVLENGIPSRIALTDFVDEVPSSTGSSPSWMRSWTRISGPTTDTNTTFCINSRPKTSASTSSGPCSSASSDTSPIYSNGRRGTTNSDSGSRSDRRSRPITPAFPNTKRDSGRSTCSNRSLRSTVSTETGSWITATTTTAPVRKWPGTEQCRTRCTPSLKTKPKTNDRESITVLRGTLRA